MRKWGQQVVIAQLIIVSGGGDLNLASLIPGMGSVPQGHPAGQVCWVGFRTSFTQHKEVIGVEAERGG